MAAKKRATGEILERMVLPALERAGLHYRRGVYIDHRPHGKRHKIDVLAWDDAGRIFLISLKWQEVGGTTEQKVPFEVLSLADAVRLGPTQYPRAACHHCGVPFQAHSSPQPIVAYLVLGGPGWTLREYYIGGGLNQHLRYADLVNIISLENFVARVNKGQL